jgi:hypothetical protein
MKKAFMGVSEYDRFGPWVDEVTRIEDVPRLYRDYPIDFDVERLVLKVPRNITRRNATPEMDLYNHLIMLGKDRLTVLTRQTGRSLGDVGQGKLPHSGKGYDAVVIPFADVVAIRSALNLLDGRLAVSTQEGTPVKVAYNGAAADVVSTLVDALREASCVKSPSPVGSALLTAGGPLARPAVEPGRGPIDTFLASAFLEAHGTNPRLSAWAAHGRRRLAPDAPGMRGTAQRLRHAISPMTLHGALFAADEHAMQIFGRNSWLQRGRAAIYSTSQLVIPFGAPDRLELAPHALYPDVTVATIGAGEWKQELPVPRGSVAEHLLGGAADTLR